MWGWNSNTKISLIRDKSEYQRAPSHAQAADVEKPPTTKSWFNYCGCWRAVFMRETPRCFVRYQGLSGHRHRLSQLHKNIQYRKHCQNHFLPALDRKGNDSNAALWSFGVNVCLSVPSLWTETDSPSETKAWYC